MNIILFDSKARESLLPLTFTCAVADLRMGIFTIKERWEMLTYKQVYVSTETYLQPLYGAVPAGENIWVDASVLPDAGVVERVLSLSRGEVFDDGNGIVATILNTENAGGFLQANDAGKSLPGGVRRLQYPWQMFQWNDAILREDFALVQSKKISQPLPADNQYINAGNIFIDEGAEVNFTILNASAGPIYIGKNAVVMEGGTIRGPFALCEGCIVKMGTKIYGATTLGPYSMVGGEIKNIVMQGYSNKGHDGYLGDSVIGKWCNLGAGTSNSNVKNTAGEVKMWSYTHNSYVNVGLKAGVIMGDYTRTAINTSLNTGTVTGVCCNIFEGGLMPKYIPGFSWGGRGVEKYKIEKAIIDIANWKKMKGHGLSDAEKEVLKYIFERGFGTGIWKDFRDAKDFGRAVGREDNGTPI